MCHRNPYKRTSLFIVTSLVYAMLLVVVCIAYVISDVTTHSIPVIYYEGFFTYLYGASILFLLYVFCFLLQESSCCNGKPPKPKEPKKEKPKKEKKEKKKETKEGEAKDGKDAGKDGKEKDGKSKGKDKDKDKDKDDKSKPSPYQEPQPDPEAGTVSTKPSIFKRKTTQDPAHGSFFLRVGAIAFGLGTMIYVGLEFGTFFEIPLESPCFEILKGVNPLLQMIFTFMQMYFIFMNARLNIHRFKVLARFGLMHIVATNICVWIRTLVLESLKEITAYHLGRKPSHEDGVILQSMHRHSIRNAAIVQGTHKTANYPGREIEILNSNFNGKHELSQESNVLEKLIESTTHSAYDAARFFTQPTTTTTAASTLTSTTTESTIPTTITTTASSFLNKLHQMVETGLSANHFEDSEEHNDHFDFTTSTTTTTTTRLPSTSTTPSTTTESVYNHLFGDEQAYQNRNNSLDQSFDELTSLFSKPMLPSPEALIQSTAVSDVESAFCNRTNYMGTIVEDSAPYLYPFIIEYSLIGAAVIYVMWKHIGRYPKYANEEDLEHRLEVMLSRRAVVMAQQARTGRVDCVGASKGLFFGLLMLVGALICLILFFVLVRHQELSLIAIYLADVSHCALMVFAILAIIIGFIRVQTLKFRCEEQSNLNDILLRISAFGLFIYSTFSVIAGSLNMFTSQPNLLVMITGIVAVLQVVLQLLFIADVSRRRVHLPEHDRSKPGRQIVTFLLICNISMFAIYTFEAQKVFANPVQLDFYGFIAWSLIQRVTLPLCIFHRFHSAVTLAEAWKTTYKARLE
uniref:Putative conserved plasma membrane protein n=1 Tax=Corethrella appendiculata TaxID=1370023 RepID=U5EQT7_9DIPT